MAPPNPAHQPRRQTQTQTQTQTQPRPLPGRLNPILCIIIALVLLALLIGLAILITYLTLRPKRLIYTLESASVQDFAINSKDDHLNAKFSYVIKSYNPEKHVTVRYRSMRISTAHHNQSVAYKEISPFKQKPRNETRIETQLVSNNVALSKFNAKDLRGEEAKGVIEMEVFITARVSYKTWIFRSRRRTLKAVCSPVMINVTSSSLNGFQRVLCKTRV